LYYCLQRLCAAELPCHFFCPQSVKERFISASFPKASAKVQPFSETASNPAIIFQKKCIFLKKSKNWDYSNYLKRGKRAIKTLQIK